MSKFINPNGEYVEVDGQLKFFLYADFIKREAVRRHKLWISVQESIQAGEYWLKRVADDHLLAMEHYVKLLDDHEYVEAVKPQRDAFKEWCDARNEIIAAHSM